MPVDPNIYNASYYKTSNYADYLERADRYKRTATEISSLLRNLSLIDDQSTILDYGCATGFLMDGLKAAGHKSVAGFEISKWATEEARGRGHLILTEVELIPTIGSIDLMIALDVFEHMDDNSILNVLDHSNPKALLVRIPSSTDGGKSFHLEISKQDPTHINCKTKEQWIKFFREFGYQTFLRLNLYTVYDTPGVSCLLIL